MEGEQAIVPIGRIEQSILLIRRQKVILDADLARLYGVTTKQLNQQVKRNAGRFPPDFMFQLSPDEKKEVVTNCDHLGNLKYFKGMPYAFTEYGAIMAASVLNSSQAVQVSLYVVRAFVKLREMLADSRQLAQRLTELDRKLQTHDRQIMGLFEAIRELMEPPPEKKRKPIGFASERNSNE